MFLQSKIDNATSIYNECWKSSSDVIDESGENTNFEKSVDLS